ncbi:NACHT, LRR and PYD domains-containing protein 3-like [Engraulis encrasicolus]|uniref:NACHT, LRR and PYD domains-containing protein 3-like n=1 Tax=Engraulis encrasicolus TaxID=184585 RepID=UPI002FD24FEA
MADSDSDDLSSATAAQTGPLQSAVAAQTGGISVCPQLHGCRVEGSVNVSVNVSTAADDTRTIQISNTKALDASTDTCIKTVSEKLKSDLRETFESVLEGIAKKGAPTLLNKIYTELYIIEGEGEGVNHEHEDWSINCGWKPQISEDISINLNDIFKPLPGDNSEKKKKDVRVVLTKGIAGIGKTVSVHKFILDWAEGKANQDVDLVIVLPFRDLNAIVEEECSLQELLEEFCPALRAVKDPKLYDSCKIVFILDGLDESKLPLNFHKNRKVSDVTKKCRVDVLITNLIQAHRLLRSAHVWITSRPAAIHKVSECVTPHRMTEVQGFSDPQKEEYFRKKITDETVSNTIVSHIKKTRSLFIMCYIPVFCWISATVLSMPDILNSLSEKIPTTLSAMYTRFLVYQTQMKNEKYHGLDTTMPLSETDLNVILKLAKLAFEHLLKGSLVFSARNLKDYGIDITDVSVQSGLFTQVVKEEDPVIREKWFSFVHLTIQEYLAALHAFHLFASEGSNPFPEDPRGPRPTFHFREYDDVYSDEESYDPIPRASQQFESLHDLHKAAIDKALKSETGHLDLFLRFLLGLSTDDSFWKHFQLQITRNPGHIKQTTQYIKDKLREKDERQLPSPERSINLFHCLTELKDSSLVDEIQRFMTSKNLSTQKISAAQCSALAYMLMTADDVIDEFNLSKYNTSREGRERLLPVVARCNRAKLGDCGLTNKCCNIIAQVLQSRDTHLTELDISHNFLTDLSALAEGLQSPYQKLDWLDLSFVNLERCWQNLIEAILLRTETQPSTLKLSGCGLKENACDILAKAMEAPGAKLKRLDVSYNYLTDAGVEKILQALAKKKCALESLRLCACAITEKSCAALAQVLQLSSLQDLDLSQNRLRDKGVNLLCSGLMTPLCQLQTLGLKDCNLYTSSCAALAPVLWSYSELKELDLTDNDLRISGLRLLSVGLRNSNCHLQILRLSGCQVTERGCALLASALLRNPDHLEELDLSYNHPGDRGKKQLSDRLEDPHCHLKKLNFEHVGEEHMQWGLEKYAVNLTLNWSDGVTMSEDMKKATKYMDMYCDFLSDSDQDEEMIKEERKDKVEVKCVQQLSGGRFYWEVDWTGWVSIKVKHKGASSDIRRVWTFTTDDHLLVCNCEQYAAVRVAYGKMNWVSVINKPDPDPKRIGVYLDWPAGLLTFYSVSAREKKVLHSFCTTFSTSVTPAFGLTSPYINEEPASITLRKI